MSRYKRNKARRSKRTQKVFQRLTSVENSKVKVYIEVPPSELEDGGLGFTVSRNTVKKESSLVDEKTTSPDSDEPLKTQASVDGEDREAEVIPEKSSEQDVEDSESSGLIDRFKRLLKDVRSWCYDFVKWTVKTIILGFGGKLVELAYDWFIELGGKVYRISKI